MTIFYSPEAQWAILEAWVMILIGPLFKPAPRFQRNGFVFGGEKKNSNIVSKVTWFRALEHARKWSVCLGSQQLYRPIQFLSKLFASVCDLQLFWHSIAPTKQKSTVDFWPYTLTACIDNIFWETFSLFYFSKQENHWPISRCTLFPLSGILRSARSAWNLSLSLVQYLRTSVQHNRGNPASVMRSKVQCST